MQVIVKSKVVTVAIALLASFIPLALLTDDGVLYVVVGAVLFTTSLAVVHAYWPALKVAINYSVEKLKYVDLLTMAIVLGFVGIAFREMYVTGYRVLYVQGLGRDDEYFVVLSFFRYTAIIAAVFALLAQKVETGRSIMDRIPGWPHVILSVGAGLILAVALVLIRFYTF